MLGGQGGGGLCHEGLRSDGFTRHFRCLVTAIYRKEGGRWLLRLWQVTPMQSP